MSEHRLGDLELRRYPPASSHTLRAWNAADLLLLEYAESRGVEPARTLVVNDEFGALSLSTGPGCTVWTDSLLACQAITENAERNGLEPPRLVAATAQPDAVCDLVLMRAPKSLSLLQYQLQRLGEFLPPGCELVCGGMDKHLPPGFADAIEQLVGATTRHRGQRKARLFSATLQPRDNPADTEIRRFYCAELGQEIESLPNVFSGGGLDMGTRALLAQFGALPSASHCIDLGCGSGILGMAALQQLPQASVDFIDESSLAVAAARRNVERLFPQRVDSCRFLQADGLLNYSGPTPELVLCNPPFHQHHVVDDNTGKRLLRQSARALPPGGELWLVANRHLPYGPTLRRYFRKVRQLGSDRKFIVWRALAGEMEAAGKKPNPTEVAAS